MSVELQVTGQRVNPLNPDAGYPRQNMGGQALRDNVLGATEELRWSGADLEEASQLRAPGSAVRGKRSRRSARC